MSDWLAWQFGKARGDVILGYYDCATSRCGIISWFLIYCLLKVNGLIKVEDMGDIPDRLEALGGQDERIRLLLAKGVLTSRQAKSLMKMHLFRANHCRHFFFKHRYLGIRCLVDGIRTVRELLSLLRDETFMAKVPHDLVPECIWGLA
jgi:hypothetical protein